jgi:5-carboxymethyl-2-hydroxymuconate isomerase
VDYVDLEVDDDFIQKCLAIKDGDTYDTRVQVPLDLPDDMMFEMMRMAHERDITLNQMVEEILKQVIAQTESGELDEEDFL